MIHQVIYFGSVKQFHFREFTAAPCGCGKKHEPEYRNELRDENGRVVLECVRNTSLQDVVEPLSLDAYRLRRDRQARR